MVELHAPDFDSDIYGSSDRPSATNQDIPTGPESMYVTTRALTIDNHLCPLTDPNQYPTIFLLFHSSIH